MMEKEDLTNEKLSKQFTNQFDLVNYAIKLADNYIKTGRPPRVKVDVENPVIQILAEIEQGKDQLVEIEFEEEEIVIGFEEKTHEKLDGKEKSKGSSAKHLEKKKSRIAR